MSFQDALVKVIFKGIDMMSGPMKVIDRQSQIMENRFKGIERIGGGLSRLGGRMMTFGGLGGGLGLGLMIKEAADAESALAQLGNIANLSEAQTKAMGAGVLALSTKVGQTQMELLGGLQTLMGAGLSSGEAMASMARLGKVATAYGADVNEAARTAFAAYSNLKVPVGQVAKLFDVLAQAGKEGNFELKDMAKELPSIAASAQMLGVSGIRGASQIGAALQIAKRGAGDPAEAANNFQNFLMKIDGPETRQKFKKMGINWSAEMKKFRASDDIFEAVGTRLNELQKKGLAIGDVFQDMQVRKFLNSFLRDVEDYKKIRDNAFNASGVVDKDFVRVSKTFNQSLKGLKTSFSALIMPKLIPFMEKLTGFFNHLAQNPKAFDKLLTLGKGLLVAAVGFKVLGGGMQLLNTGFMRDGIMSGAFARSIQGVTGVMGPLAGGLPGLLAAAGPLLPIIGGLALATLLFVGGLALINAKKDMIGESLGRLSDSWNALKESLGGLGDAFKMDLGEFGGEIDLAAVAAEFLVDGLTLATDQLRQGVEGAKMLGHALNFAMGPLRQLIAGAGAFYNAKMNGASDLTAGMAAAKAAGAAGVQGQSAAMDRMVGATLPTLQSGIARGPRASRETAVDSARYPRYIRDAVGKSSTTINGLVINLDPNDSDREVADKVAKEIRKARQDRARTNLRSGPDNRPMLMAGAH